MSDNVLFIKGGRVLTPDADPHIPPFQDIYVEDGKITQIGIDIPEPTGAQFINATDRLVIPGFINAHYHSHDTLGKGVMEETPLETWRLLALPPAYPKRSREEIRARTLLGALECLRSGMTTVQDMVTLFPFDTEHLEVVIEAYEEIGIRAVIALQYGDIKGIDTIPFWREVFPKEFHDKLTTAAEPEKKIDLLSHFSEVYLDTDTFSDRISWALGPSAPERCSRALIERTVELSEKYNIPIFTHIYESKGMALQARREYPQYSGSLIRRLREEGLLGPKLNLAHSVWLLPDEIEILGETGTKVVINPLSNAKLKSGFPPIRALQNAGINLGIGCDNCSCSDAQNIFQAMKLFCLMVALSHLNAGPPQAQAAFDAATTGGANAIGQPNLGKITVGSKADLVMIDLMDPSYIPLNSAVRQLVYTEGGRGVKTVIVDGKVIIHDGKLQTMDEEALIEEIMAVIPNFQKDFKFIKSRVSQMKPYLEEAHRRIWAEEVGMDRLFHEKPASSPEYSDD